MIGHPKSKKGAILLMTNQPRLVIKDSLLIKLSGPAFTQYSLKKERHRQTHKPRATFLCVTEAEAIVLI